MAGIAQPELDALADDLGAAAAGHGALHPGGSLVQLRSGAGSAGALEAGALGAGQTQGDGAGEHPIEGDVGEVCFRAQGDLSTGEVLANGVVFAGNGDRAGGIEGGHFHNEGGPALPLLWHATPARRLPAGFAWHFLCERDIPARHGFPSVRMVPHRVGGVPDIGRRAVGGGCELGGPVEDRRLPGRTCPVSRVGGNVIAREIA